MDVRVVRRLETAGVPELSRLGPWATRAVMPIEGRRRDEPWGLVSQVNLLAGAILALPKVAGPIRVICWTGWLPEEFSPDQGVFYPALATWTGEGWKRLCEVVRWLGPAMAERGQTLCLRPHARHVLSDPSSCLKFLREHEDVPVEVVLEPAAMLTPGMLTEAQVHLTRIVETIGRMPRVAGVLASNVETVESEEHEPELRLTPLMSGELDPEWIARPIRSLGSGSVVLLLEEGLPRQLSLIRPAGRA